MSASASRTKTSKTSRQCGTRSTTWSPAWADPLPTDALLRFAERLGCPFTDPDLLALAFTHRSWCAEHAGHESNERLEFLGDAVLGLVVAAHVYERFTGRPEGELAKIRASVVSRTALAEVAAEAGLGEHMRLGKGENASGGRVKLSILSDAMEAVIGAVYLDQGFPAAQGLVLRLLGDRIDIAAEGPGGLDFKSQLQELVTRDFEQLPEYEISGDGPEHEPRFLAIVRVAGQIEGAGEGRSKKLAEQAAARAAWLRLSDRPVADADADADAGPASDPGPDSGPATGAAVAPDASPSDSATVPPVAPTGPNPAQPTPTVTGGSRESEMHDA